MNGLLRVAALLAKAKWRSVRALFRSLGVQLALLTAFCLIGAIGTFGCFLAQDYVRAMEQNVVQRNAVTARQVANGLAGALLVRDYLAVENQLLILEPVPGFRDAYVVSTAGAVISHVTADGSGFLKAVFNREVVASPQDPAPRQVHRGDVLESWHPIAHPQLLGWVRLVSDLSPFYAEQRQIYWRTALAGLLAAVLSLALLLWFLRPRIRALNALTDFARRLNAGTNELLAVYRGSTDIEALGVNLSHAAQRIAADARALQLEESRLRTVVENMPVLMNAFDETVGFLVWNKTCERVTGYTAAEIVGNPEAVEMLYPDRTERETMLEQWRRLKGGGFRDWPLTLTTKTGERRTISWSNLSDDFPIPGWSTWSVGIDITQARENERLKDEFVSTVNHELRTPLTAIHGALRLIMSDMIAPLAPQTRRLVDIAERNCGRLERLISNVLDLQCIQSGMVRPVHVPVDIGPLLRDAADVHRPWAALNGIILTQIEEAGASFTVYGDADKLMQVVTNLLSNAIKFSPPGSLVEVEARMRGDDILIEVRDQGPGIAEEFASRIFQRFARAQAGPSQQVGGSGLGLCITKAIVEQHHGIIEFENNPGGGATFRVVLPALSSTARAAS